MISSNCFSYTANRLHLNVLSKVSMKTNEVVNIRVSVGILPTYSFHDLMLSTITLFLSHPI